jgi:ubiquinone/menaquinone biosynthesis C-methylase UbiE
MSKVNSILVFMLFFICRTNAFAVDTYVLAEGQKSLRRLELQDELLKAYTDEHLQKANLSEGQTVWDIGCGPGTMTVELARRVGDTGHVYAIDFNQEQLTIAQRKVAAAGLKNVTFILGDIRSQKNLPLGNADLVYIRFVLSHVNNPEIIVRMIKSLLKKGGVVASQEPIMTSCYEPSNHEIFRQYRDTVADLGRKIGNDYDLGKRLKSLYDQEEFAKTEGYFIQPIMNLTTAKELFLLDIAEWTDKAIKLGVLTPDKLENWKDTMRNWPSDDKAPYSMAKYAYVLAWK